MGCKTELLVGGLGQSPKAGVRFRAWPQQRTLVGFAKDDTTRA